MQPFPHRYTVAAEGHANGDVELHSDRLSTLRSASPAEFDGPGNRWSPETLLVGAVGDCLILTFRAVARASRLEWTTIVCEVTGTLDRVDHITRFVDFEIRVSLRVPNGVDPERAKRALEKAEQNCLISNSLNAAIHLVPTIEVVTALHNELIPAGHCPICDTGNRRL
jgi:organic hydroperoxide reductase OsmC/OhrA